jgi:hypothetical protein
MKDPLFNTLSGLASLGIVLAAVLLASGGRDRPAAHAGQPRLVEAVMAAELQAGEEAQAPQRRSHRVRASLAMPYFSFAQSLRPGG